MSAQKVLECYHKLSTSEQQFCQACALVFFRPLYQADYLPYLLHQEKKDLVNDLLDGTDLSGKLSDEELLAIL